MQREVFKVPGANLKKRVTVENFSRYAARNGAPGTIAATGFHVQKKELDFVERIIE